MDKARKRRHLRVRNKVRGTAARPRLNVYRSLNQGVNYDPASSNEFSERVTLPQTWLFVSGAHDITVVSEDEANRD